MTSNVAGALETTLDIIVPKLADVPLNAVNQFNQIATKEISNLGKIVQGVSDKAMDFAGNALETAINAGIDKLPFGEAINGVLKVAANGLCTTIKEAGKELLHTALEGGQEIMGKVVDKVTNVAKKTLGAICNFLCGKAKPAEVINDTKEAFKEALNEIKDNTISVAANTIQSAKKAVEKIEVSADQNVKNATNIVISTASNKVTSFVDKLAENRAQPPSPGNLGK